MASLPPSLRDTLAYFAKYNYPLTAEELWFWQHGTRISKFKIFSLNSNFKFQNSNWQLRKQREEFSKKKWLIAKKVGESLKKFPSITAVFVTGALAMNNCPKDDDIDFMIVTYPNTLWITRFFVNLFLWSNRRLPGQSQAPNKICPNLWLDTRNLKLEIRNLYVAHETLQAKVLWDRAGIHSQFLRTNSWVKKYLPVAFKFQTSNLKIKPLISNFYYLIFWPLNLLFFLPQYLYMLPKMTSERVNLGFAFFHPNKKFLRTRFNLALREK